MTPLMITTQDFIHNLTERDQEIRNRPIAKSIFYQSVHSFFIIKLNLDLLSLMSNKPLIYFILNLEYIHNEIFNFLILIIYKAR
jgi:hypothetical protein